MVLLKIEEVSKAFGRKKVLERVSLKVNQGEIVGLVGNSGVGKSVLIKTLIGFFMPDFGKIIVESKKKYPIGFSMQENSLYDNLTLRQNLNFFSEIYGIERKNRKSKIEEVFNFLKLKDYENVLVKNLSGGTKKRGDIACAFLSDPEILILDEPFIGLDPSLAESLVEIIRTANKSGKTFIISEHRIDILKEICTDFAWLYNRKLEKINKADLEYIY